VFDYYNTNFNLVGQYFVNLEFRSRDSVVDLHLSHMERLYVTSGLTTFVEKGHYDSIWLNY